MKPRWQRRPGGLPTLIAFSIAVLMGASAGAQETSTPAPPTPEPLAKDALLAGQDVPVPSRKKYVAPVYPPQAAIEGIRGIVILEVLIGEDGAVGGGCRRDERLLGAVVVRVAQGSTPSSRVPDAGARGPQRRR